MAIIPLSLYLASVIASLLLNKLYVLIGRKKTFSIGAILLIASDIILAFLNKSSRNFIYPVAVLVGFS